MGCVRVCSVVDPDGGFQGVWRVCVCHSCTCDMRDTCTTATGISQESAVQTLRGGREPRRKFLEERTRDTRRPRFRRGRKSATFATRGEIGDFLGGAKIGDFCHFGKSATFVPGGKRGPAAILINAYSGDFCHPVLSNAVAPEPLVYHSGTKCAILGHFRAPPPFLAILGHFGPFWAFLALFGPFWPPPGPPPAPLFGPEFPRTSPKTSPRTSAMRKISAHIPEEKIFPPHTPRTMSENIFPPHTPRKTPPHKSAQNSPAHFGAQNPDTNSAQILPRTFVHKFPGRKFCANVSGEKLEHKVFNV